MKQKILYLNEEDVHSLGVADMKQAIVDVEECLKLYYKGDAIVPDKISMGFGKDFFEEGIKGRINCMPGFLGGEYNMAGVKWIGSNPSNTKIGLPRANAITVLNDPVTKAPVCVMNGNEPSMIRTGAASGVAAKYLVKKNAKTILLVGAGPQNMTQLEAMYCVRPSLENIYVCDINPAAGENFAKVMGDKLHVNIIPITKMSDCPVMPDITTNATSVPVPVVDIDMVGAGCTHFSVGGLDHPDLYKKADKLICDSWSQARHRGSSYLTLAGQRGEVTDDDIYCKEIGEIICGEKPGRENDTELIYYKPVGMGIEDIALCAKIYRKALETNTGTMLDY